MPRRQRIHVPGGTYYIVQQGQGQRPIFANPQEYALFEQLLENALQRTNAHLHAYCWTRDTFHLVLEIDHAPVWRVMQDLNSHYARRLRVNGSGPFFTRRYRLALIDPDAYLVPLTQYVHHIPVLTGLASSPDKYPYTSHHVYLGGRCTPWVFTRAVLRRLNSLDEERLAYRRSMVNPIAADVRELFERGTRMSQCIFGELEFLDRLPRNARRKRPRVSLNDVANNVSRVLGIPLGRVMSSSRQRELALARALITWYAVERRIATQLEVSRYLGRSPSTLSAGVSRYRTLRPELFTLDAFRHLVPLATISSTTERQRQGSGDELQNASP